MARTTKVTAWDGAAEVPRAGIPDAVTLSKQSKRWRRAVTWWPVLAPAVIAIGVVSADGATPPEPVEAIATTDGRAAAQDALSRWLAQDPSPLPGGHLLSWDGATAVQVPEPANPSEIDSAYEMEINEFTLVTSAGQMYTAGVQVATSERLGAYVVGGPSLTPLMPAASQSEWSAVQAWPGYTLLPAPQPVIDAVTAWAGVFTGDDAAQLRLATGDGDTTHYYMPLVGVGSAQAKVTDAAVITQSGDGPPTQIVVRAELSVKWANTKDTDTDTKQGAGDEAAKLTYDLLIDRADTGAPAVVAWGAPGTGPSLTPFANAVTGRAVEVSQPPVKDTTASPTSTADGD